ncbi:Hsp70 family protein [Salinispira pacifica]|uniref:Uncharacterized protein n=1 Tax=Salinispira pacifica TaxID=1307761 RepID=V5WDQ7_9SPIO|nr:Hsp70 family protein [Salinispira pacifica]AHC13699.1 hypothetical protein L21SP2_0257 [Salinispira pacifica]
MIGIRLADGTYYPVLDESSHSRKRFVLTPAHENQHSVHVLFYHAEDGSFSNPRPIGRLDLDQLAPAESVNEQEISIAINAQPDGKLNITARDEKGGTTREIILDSIPDEENMFSDEEFHPDDDISLPEPGDFIGDKEDMEALHREAAAHGGVLEAPVPDNGPQESSFDEMDDMFQEEDGYEGGDEYPESDEEFDAESHFVETRKGIRTGVLAALVLIFTAALIGLSFLIFSLMKGEPVPPLEADADDLNGRVVRMVQTDRRDFAVRTDGSL